MEALAKILRNSRITRFSCRSLMGGLAKLNCSPVAVSKVQIGPVSPGIVPTSLPRPNSIMAKARQYWNMARTGSGWASIRDPRPEKSVDWLLVIGFKILNFKLASHFPET
jgi:hypothetical protein